MNSFLKATFHLNRDRSKSVEVSSSQRKTLKSKSSESTLNFDKHTRHAMQKQCSPKNLFEADSKYLFLSESYYNSLNRKGSDSSSYSAKTDTNINTTQKTSISSASSSATNNTKSFSFLGLNKISQRVKNAFSIGNLVVNRKRRTLLKSVSTESLKRANSPSGNSSVVKSSSCKLYGHHVQRKIPTIYIDCFESYYPEVKHHRYRQLDELFNHESESRSIRKQTFYCHKSFEDSIFVRYTC
jgi:hypothetical protein